MFSTLLVTDSRGTYLQEEIETLLKSLELVTLFNVKTLPASGATIGSIYYTIEEELRSSTYDLMIVFVGVNDLTKLHKPSKRVSPNFTEVGNLVEVLTDKYTLLRIKLRALNQRFVLTHIIGIDLNVKNETTGRYLAQQDVINEGCVLM